MKLARASTADLNAVAEFFHTLEAVVEYGSYQDGDREVSVPDAEALGELVQRLWPSVSAAWCRVVYGAETLIRNCCDPDAMALEWRKDIAAAMAAAGING